MVVHTKITVAPRFVHDFLRKAGATLLQLGVELIELMSEDVYSYWGMASRIDLEQMNRNIIPLDNCVIPSGHFHDNAEAELLLVIFDSPLQIRNGNFGCNSG